MIILFKDENKHQKIVQYLQQIYGLSYNRSSNVCKFLGFDINSKFNELTLVDIRKIEDILLSKKKYTIDSDLKKYNFDNIKHKQNIKSYQGLRHLLKLSVNGQNTKTNAKTQKWKRQ